jgi:hypothetical protein
MFKKVSQLNDDIKTKISVIIKNQNESRQCMATELNETYEGNMNYYKIMSFDVCVKVYEFDKKIVNEYYKNGNLYRDCEYCSSKFEYMTIGIKDGDYITKPFMTIFDFKNEDPDKYLSMGRNIDEMFIILNEMMPEKINKWFCYGICPKNYYKIVKIKDEEQ